MDLNFRRALLLLDGCVVGGDWCEILILVAVDVGIELLLRAGFGNWCLSVCFIG